MIPDVHASRHTAVVRELPRDALPPEEPAAAAEAQPAAAEHGLSTLQALRAVLPVNPQSAALMRERGPAALKAPAAEPDARRGIGRRGDSDRAPRREEEPPQQRKPAPEAAPAASSAPVPGTAPAASTAPTASPTELGMVDLMLADPLNEELIRTWGGSGALPASELARQQTKQLGSERATKLAQLHTAIGAVREEYQRAIDAAASQRPPEPVFDPLRTRTGERFDAPPGWQVVLDSVSEGSPCFSIRFSAEDYTAWYARQDTLAGRAFAALYGQARTTVESSESYTAEHTVVGSNMFSLHLGSRFNTDESGSGTAWQPGRIEMNGPLVPVGLGGEQALHDPQAVWFDPSLGFVTTRENIVEKEHWLDKAMPVLVTGAILYATGGAGGAFSTAGGQGTIMGAVTSATGSSALGAAALGGATGALAATVNGVFSGKLRLKDVFRAALSGAVTGGVMQATGFNTLGLDKSGQIVSYAQRAVAITGAASLQGALSKLAGGEFKDGFKAGLTAGVAQGLANEVAGNMARDVEARLARGEITAVDASALRTLSRATGSAIRALASPDDPGHAFAAEFIGNLVNDGVEGLRAAAPATQAAPSNAAPVAEAPVAAEQPAPASPTPPDEPNKPATSEPKPTTIEVQGGDSLTRIAEQLAGKNASRWAVNEMKAQLAAANPQLADLNALWPGQVLNLPDASTVVDRATRDRLAQADAQYRADQQPPTPKQTVVWPNEDGGLRLADGLPGSFAAGAMAPGAADPFAPGIVSPVPEPSTAALAAGGAAVVTGAPVAGRIGAAARALLGAMAPEAVAALPWVALGTGINLAIPSPGSPILVTDLGDDLRFVRGHDMQHGELQRKTADGEWATERWKVHLVTDGPRYAVLSDEEMQRLRAMTATPGTPLPPQNTPGTAVLPENERDIGTPGFEAAAPPVPDVITTPIRPITIDDLIVDKSNSEVLGNNLRAVGDHPPHAGYEPHHIVPSNAGGAAMGAVRMKLAALGVDLNSAENGVWLPTSRSPIGAPGAYHPRLNNAEYLEAVARSFTDARTKGQAEAILRDIKGQLLSETFPGVRPRQ